MQFVCYAFLMEVSMNACHGYHESSVFSLNHTSAMHYHDWEGTMQHAPPMQLR
jgi:hypothetical protein